MQGLSLHLAYEARGVLEEAHGDHIPLHEHLLPPLAHVVDLHIVPGREFFIDNLLIRIYLIIEMILVDRPCAMRV